MTDSREPCTLYKPQDITYARENLKRYGWAQKIVDGWRSEAAYALEQDRDFFEALIPELTPGSHYGQNCPHCVGCRSSGEAWQECEALRISLETRNLECHYP